MSSIAVARLNHDIDELEDARVATYLLIHGAGSDAWCWHRLEPQLRERGHDVVAVDLPCDDDRAGLADYADVAAAAVELAATTGGGGGELVVVAHSFGGFTAPLVCERLPVDLLVLLQAMVPLPGETAADWWHASGCDRARRAYDRQYGPPADDLALFAHALDPDLAHASLARARPQSGAPMVEPWPMDAWPDVPTRFLLSRDDRFFPAAFLRELVVRRLGIVADEMPGDHLPMLGHPRQLADRLEVYRRGLPLARSRLMMGPPAGWARHGAPRADR